LSIRSVSTWTVLLIAFFQVAIHSVASAQEGNTIVTLPGGKVTLFGSVLNGGCLASIRNSDKIVLMGEVRTNQFLGVGSDSQAVPFSIQLDDCASNISESVAVGFSGVANEQDLRVLAIAPGTNAAQGIGLALFDANNNLLPINTAPSHFATLNNGVNTLHFLAKYRLTQLSVVPGVADAWADVTLTYQ
jgi:fimbrial protein